MEDSRSRSLEEAETLKSGLLQRIGEFEDEILRMESNIQILVQENDKRQQELITKEEVIE